MYTRSCMLNESLNFHHYFLIKLHWKIFWLILVQEPVYLMDDANEKKKKNRQETIKL